MRAHLRTPAAEFSPSSAKKKPLHTQKNTDNQKTTTIVASLVFATGALAHAALNVCCSKAALTALALPARVLRVDTDKATTTAATRRLSAASATKKHGPVEIQMHAVPSIKAVSTISEIEEAAVAVEEEAAVDEKVVVEEVIEEIQPVQTWRDPPTYVRCSNLKQEETSPDVVLGAEAVWTKATELGASQPAADAGVAMFFQLADEGWSLPKAMKGGMRRAKALIFEEEAAKEGRSWIYTTSSAAAASAGFASSSAAHGAGSLMAWATACPQNWAVFTMGAQAAAIVSVAAMAAIAVTGVAVGALGAVAITRAVRRARASAALPGPRPTSAGLLLPPPHPSAFAGGVQRVWIADDAPTGLPLRSPPAGSSIWAELAGGWDALCECAADAAELWEALGVPGGGFEGDGPDCWVPPPPPPMAHIPGAATLPRGVRGPRRFVE
jgi:hypothetical protein